MKEDMKAVDVILEDAEDRVSPFLIKKNAVVLLAYLMFQNL